MLELGAGVSGAQLVEIVDHRRNDSGRFGQFGYNRVDDRIAVKMGAAGCRRESATLRSPDRLQDGKQNCGASCWSRGTDTKATRRSPLARSDHARSSDVFPLPEARR